jgi:hypothetical protein
MSVGHASPLLPLDHWTRRAARRLHAAALTPAGFDPATGTFTVRDALRVFEYAREHAPPAWQSIADGYLDQLHVELGHVIRPTERKWTLRAAAAAGGAIESMNGIVAPGVNDELRVWIPDESASDLTTAGVTHQAYVTFGALAASANVVLMSGSDCCDADAPLLIAGGELGPVGLFAGRWTPGYRTTESGAVVLQGVVPFDGVGLHLTRPFRLPGFLRAIGPIDFETFGARAADAPGVYNPWFWTARAHLQPFAWLDFGVTRALHSGSAVPGRSPTLGDLLNTIIGQNGKDYTNQQYFDNQIVAVDGWIRPPLPVPLSFYWDWGAEDSSGAWWQEPGRVFGLSLAAVPGAPAVGAGVERTLFPWTCCDGGDWYKHYQKRDGWAEQGTALGHPLGGHGFQTRVYANADVMQGRVQLDGALFRNRRGEQNLYAPLMQGHSVGGMMAAGVRVAGFLGDMKLSYENGDGWTQTMFTLSARHVF